MIDRAAARQRDVIARKDAEYLPRARALHDMVIRPLWLLLGGASRLFLVPGRVMETS